MKYLLTFILLATVAVPAHAQSYRALVPIAPQGEIPGAFGSRWATFVSIHNMGQTTVPSCPGGIATKPAYAPGVTGAFPAGVSMVGQVGAFVCVPGTPETVTLTLRVQDLSRQALTWGTAIPVVLESDVRTQLIALVDMPTDDRFCQTLRIYDWDRNSGEPFRLRILRADGSVVVDDILTPLPAPADPALRGAAPGYTEVQWVAGIYPEITAEERVTLHISPVNGGVRFWAFVSVTNNETQHVTTITP